jgi:hypothetical protein
LLGVRFIRNSLRRLECLALGYAEGEVRDAKKHDYHGDYGRVGNRAGHCASAVCILGNAWKAGWCRSGRYYQQAGPGLSGSGPYNAPGRASQVPLPGAAFTLRPSALRRTSHDASMTTLGAPGTLRTGQPTTSPPRARRTDFSHRVGASMANGLRPLYCPWPRCFVYHTIPFGAALALPP